MDNFSNTEKSNSVSPNFNTNLGQPGAPVMHPPTEGSGYPLPGSYSQEQGGYPLQPVMNATAPETDYTTIVGEGNNWMPVPVGVPICPPGLEYLTVIGQLIFYQKGTEIFKPKNKFSIKNSFGQKIYSAEETEWLSWNCSYIFDMNIKGSDGNDVIQLITRSECCCQMRMEVMSPPGIPIGSVVRESYWLNPHFSLLDASGEIVLIIKGRIHWCSEIDFQILSRDGSGEVGRIKKLYAGFKSGSKNRDKLDVTFPMELDVNIKAVLLGACMLIDRLFFDTRALSQTGFVYLG